MQRTIRTLKEMRTKAVRSFVDNSLIIHRSPDAKCQPDTTHDLEMIDELTCAIKALDMLDNVDVIVEDADDFMRELKLFKNVTRFEVIDNIGRTYTKHELKKIEFSRQDQGRTLKVFLK